MVKFMNTVNIDDITHRTAWTDSSWMFGKTVCQIKYATNLRGFDESFQLGEYRLAPVTCIACMGDMEWPWP